MFFRHKIKKAGVFALALGFTIGAAGCGKGTGNNVQIEGVNGPNVSVVNGVLMITATLTNVEINGGVTLPIPHFPNSFVEVGPDLQSNGMLLALGISSVDIQALMGDPQSLDPATLPGGRPLPGVAAGELPAVALQIPQLDNMTVYIGPQVLGAFVPVKFGTTAAGAIVTFAFKDGSNNQIGTISIIGADTMGANSGFLLLLDPSAVLGKKLGL